MRTKSVSTEAEGLKYEVTVQLFESRQEVDAALGDDGVLGTINAAQEQNGKQGDKTRVRDAVRLVLAKKAGLKVAEKGFDVNAPAHRAALAKARAAISNEDLIATKEVAEAIEAHKKNAAEYIIGKPRGGNGGPTKKSKESLGDAIVTFKKEKGRAPNQAELDAIMKETLGI